MNLQKMNIFYSDCHIVVKLNLNTFAVCILVFFIQLLIKQKLKDFLTCIRRGCPPALRGLQGRVVFSATLSHFSLTEPPPSIMLSSDSLSWSLLLGFSSSGMWTSWEDPGRGWMETLAPPDIPVLPLCARWLWLLTGTVLAASFMYCAGMWPPARISTSWPEDEGMWAPARNSASRPMADGSEEQRNSMFLWGEEEGSGLIPSITCMDSFLLSFLFFHWLSSCLDRVESMEVWMEAWRRGIRPSSPEEPPWDLENDKMEFTQKECGKVTVYAHLLLTIGVIGLLPRRKLFLLLLQICDNFFIDKPVSLKV